MITAASARGRFLITGTLLYDVKQMSTRLSSEYSTLSLSCLIRKSSGDATYSPLVILLHGYGSNEADLFVLAEKFPPEFLVVCARAPHTLSLGQYAWYALDYSSGVAVHDEKEAGESRLLLKKFIDQVCKEFAVDTQRIFIMGFSQGAIMSYSVALTFPTLIRGVGALSGRILEEIKPIVNVERKVGQAKLAVFVAHGTQDKVIPVAHAREAKEYLEGQDITLTYSEYAIPHAISGIEAQALIEWLLQVNGV